METNLDAVPILLRREIEARVLGPLINTLIERYGKKPALEMVRPMILAQAKESGRTASARAGGNTLSHYAEAKRDWAAEEALKEELVELTDKVFRWNVTHCAYAEMYRKLGLADLGYELSCARDYAMVSGFNPKMILHRTKTIMGGDDICDFEVTLEQGNGKRCTLKSQDGLQADGGAYCCAGPPDQSEGGSAWKGKKRKVKRFHAQTWQSDLGPLTAISTDKGLAGLLFGSPDLMMEADRLAGRSSWELIQGLDPILDRTRVQVEEFLTGKRTDFEIELDLSGTEFQRQVWQALQEIPYGSVVTYGRLARMVGRPKAVRAVGQANGANPVPIVVPCHRVVAVGGLGGYGGGLPIKRLLLGIEGVTSADVKAAGRVG